MAKNNDSNYGRPMCKDFTWNKGKIISGKNPKIWRMDKGKNIIKYNDHGNYMSPFGWDIDHIISKADGGSDIIENLQPLKYNVNRSCGNKTDKPGMNNVILHEARKKKQLERVSESFTPPKRSFRIMEDTIMYVKQSPITKFELAKIIKINKKSVLVNWLYSNYTQEIIYDIDLFENIPTKRTRSK